MNKNIILYLRDEINNNEFRTPLTPKDIKILINNNFTLYVRSSENRIYSDVEYYMEGAIITNDPWYDSKFSDALIIGLKEIDNLHKLNRHNHIYFSHSFKNQHNSYDILNAFYKSSSNIYDFEYFLDNKNNNKRIIAFGFYAGIVGCILGILQYLTKKIYGNNIENLKPYENEEDMINRILQLASFDISKLNIGIIGATGNCGKGVITILDKLGIPYNNARLDSKYFNQKSLANFDIFYNCILLNEKYDEVFFDSNTIFNKYITIVDISCDYLMENNPIKLYNNHTTWDSPVFNYNNFVDIIAINNLPSLLPKDSSNYFSEKFVDLLLDFKKDNNNYWKNNKEIFKKKISNFNMLCNYK